MNVGKEQVAPETPPPDGAAEQDENQSVLPPPTHAGTRSPFTATGRLTERETKRGTVYLAGEILGLRIFVFPRADGSWRIFTFTAVPSAEALPTHQEAEPMAAYTHTVDNVRIPDPGEPIRGQALPPSSEPMAWRRGRCTSARR